MTSQLVFHPHRVRYSRHLGGIFGHRGQHTASRIILRLPILLPVSRLCRTSSCISFLGGLAWRGSTTGTTVSVVIECRGHSRCGIGICSFTERVADSGGNLQTCRELSFKSGRLTGDVECVRANVSRLLPEQPEFRRWRGNLEEVDEFSGS